MAACTVVSNGEACSQTAWVQILAARPASCLTRTVALPLCALVSSTVKWNKIPSPPPLGVGLMREYKKNVKADEKVCLFNSIFLICPWDFPGGPGVKNLPCDAGDAGAMQETQVRCLAGKLRSHVPQQLSPQATTREPARHNGRHRVMQCRSHVPHLRPDSQIDRYF